MSMKLLSVIAVALAMGYDYANLRSFAEGKGNADTHAETRAHLAAVAKDAADAAKDAEARAMAAAAVAKEAEARAAEAQAKEDEFDEQEEARKDAKEAAKRDHSLDQLSKLTDVSSDVDSNDGVLTWTPAVHTK